MEGVVYCTNAVESVVDKVFLASCISLETFSSIVIVNEMISTPPPPPHPPCLMHETVSYPHIPDDNACLERSNYLAQ